MLARRTRSTASTLGGASQARTPVCVRPSYRIIRARRSPVRTTDSRTPSSGSGIVSPGAIDVAQESGGQAGIRPREVAKLHGRRVTGRDFRWAMSAVIIGGIADGV
jgi:hypothetical protein